MISVNLRVEPTLTTKFFVSNTSAVQKKQTDPVIHNGDDLDVGFSDIFSKFFT
jgi:hypothetical protein